jgi:predicted anti-sigma-YlaC factor YlaD
MGHISALGLFDYLAGKADLTTQETEHLQDCDDCRDDAIEMRRVLQDSADIEKARHFLAEEGKLPLGTEPPKETHEEQRELPSTAKRATL